MSWGSHCCHFYGSSQDLLDTLVPYFRAGLEARELCLWVLHEPITEAMARRALRRDIPGADGYLADGSIEIVPSEGFYLKDGRFSRARVMREWSARLAHAKAGGYVGLRASGNTAWLARSDWRRSWNRSC